MYTFAGRGITVVSSKTVYARGLQAYEAPRAHHVFVLRHMPSGTTTKTTNVPSMLATIAITVNNKPNIVGDPPGEGNATNYTFVITSVRWQAMTQVLHRETRSQFYCWNTVRGLVALSTHFTGARSRHPSRHSVRVGTVRTNKGVRELEMKCRPTYLSLPPCWCRQRSERVHRVQPRNVRVNGPHVVGMVHNEIRHV